MGLVQGGRQRAWSTECYCLWVCCAWPHRFGTAARQLLQGRNDSGARFCRMPALTSRALTSSK